MRTYRVPLVGVFLGHFRLSICIKLARSILMNDRNIAIEFPPSKQQNLLLPD